MIDSLMGKNRQPFDHNLGFHSRLTQTSFQSPLPSSKNKHFKLQQPLDFGLSVKGWESKLLISCNLIGGNQQPLSTLNHGVKHPLIDLNTCESL